MFRENQLKKKAVFFGLEDVLVPGEIDSKVNLKEVEKILSNLQKTQKENKFFFAVVSGHTKEIGLEKIKKFGLEKFFNEKNSFFVDDEYIRSKEEIDKKIHLKGLEKNPLFQDEFFKKCLIEKEIEKRGFSKEETIYIGHDILLDGFYLWRFAKIECAFLKESFSEKNKKRKEKVKNQIYARRNWNDVQKIILGKFKKPDHDFLETAVITGIREQLVDTPEVKRIVLERKKIEKNKQIKILFNAK